MQPARLPMFGSVPIATLPEMGQAPLRKRKRDSADVGMVAYTGGPIWCLDWCPWAAEQPTGGPPLTLACAGPPGPLQLGASCHQHSCPAQSCWNMQPVRDAFCYCRQCFTGSLSGSRFCCCWCAPPPAHSQPLEHQGRRPCHGAALGNPG